MPKGKIENAICYPGNCVYKATIQLLPDNFSKNAIN